MPDEAARYGDQPLGKSVEEVERESGESSTRPTDDEMARHAGDTPIEVPAIVNSNASSVPAVLTPGALTDTRGADTTPTSGSADTSEP